MKKSYSMFVSHILILLVLSASVCGCSQKEESLDLKENVLFQYSVLCSLMEGIYDGDMTVGDLKGEGNFGLGTFEGLDGEMVILDGAAYQVKGDGSVNEANDDSLVPFAQITLFDIDYSKALIAGTDYESFKQVFRELVPSDNLFYAIKVSGEFSFLKTRSVHMQEKPYESLEDALEKQVIFDFKNSEGVMVGFYYPESFDSSIAPPGFHLHYISNDKKYGGHVLEFITDSCLLEVDEIYEMKLLLPAIEDYLEADFGTN